MAGRTTNWLKDASVMAQHIEHIDPVLLRPWAKNARTHSRKQKRQIADSIRTVGFTNPVLIDQTNTILAGHGRVEAAKSLGMEAVLSEELRLPWDRAVR